MRILPKVRRVVLVMCSVALAVAMAGCTSGSDPGEPTSPETTADEPAGPTPLTGAEMTALLVDGFNLVLAAPEDPAAQEEVRGEWAGLTIADSPAAEYFDTLVASMWSDFVMRGDAIGEAMSEPTLDGETATGTVCMSVTATRVGAPEDDPMAGVRYAEDYVPFEVTAQGADDGWLLSDIVGSGEARSFCVPPTVADAVTDNWQGYVDARAAVVAGGVDDPVASVGEWLTDPMRGELTGDASEWEPIESTTDLVVHRATRSDAVGSWCQSVVFDDVPISMAVEGTWLLEADSWLLSNAAVSTEQSEPTGEFPEEAQRCY